MIRAECHSDDMAVTAKFDATPFFEEASDAELLGLVRCGFGGDYAADAVAQHLEDRAGYHTVEAVLDHARGRGDIGFECHVHAADALSWVKENRPNLFERVREELDGVDAGGAPRWDSDPSWDGDYAVSSPPTP